MKLVLSEFSDILSLSHYFSSVLKKDEYFNVFYTSKKMLMLLIVDCVISKASRVPTFPLSESLDIVPFRTQACLTVMQSLTENKVFFFQFPHCWCVQKFMLI